MTEQDAPGTTRTGETSTDDAGLHDMGGDIGAASIRASSARGGSGSAQDAAPETGYAQDLGPMAGRDEEQPGVAGSDDSGYGSPVHAPVPGAPSLVVDIDEGDQVGRGADGDSAARMEQKQDSGL